MYQSELLSLKTIEPIKQGFVELIFHNPGSVNVFNMDTVAELNNAISTLQQQKNIKGLLVTSSKSVFIAGADISEFTGKFDQPEAEIIKFFDGNNQNLAALEQLPFPSVVAINGFALGGGLEFCLATDIRIMSSKAKIGLPETGLGIIPAWGGTVRLPRLIAPETAAAWMVSGKHYSAQAALDSGAVSHISAPDQLRDDAIQWLQRAVDGDINYQAIRMQKTQGRSINTQQLENIHNAGVDALGRSGSRYTARTEVLELIKESVTLEATQALELEARCFAKLSKTPQARAMVGNFLNQQTLNKIAKQHAKKANIDVSRALVLGAGIMGGGISYQTALNNIPVTMKDVTQDGLDAGMAEANNLLDKQLKRGRIDQAFKDNILTHMTPTLDYPNPLDVDIIVESVVENEAVKSNVLADVESKLPVNKVMVSNTSTISITRLGKSLQRPENFCGMHFFNPVHAMPLVEVIRGAHTSSETIGAVVAYALNIRKQVVVVNDCPAFLINRVMFPYFAGFERLIEEGVDFREIDRVMEAWGWPMGPAYLADVIGMDTMVHCSDVLRNDFVDRMNPDYQIATEKLFTNQRLGQKNGLGFYEYSTATKGVKQYNSEVADLLYAGKLTQVSDEEMMIRCLLPMAIETARCLEESVVSSPAEVDISLQYGLGFPDFVGGICRWMDECGLKQICQWGDHFQHLGPLYQPTAQQRAMAQSSQTYHG